MGEVAGFGRENQRESLKRGCGWFERCPWTIQGVDSKNGDDLQDSKGRNGRVVQSPLVLFISRYRQEQQRMGRRPDKKELARIKAMTDFGIRPTPIAKKIGRSHHMVIKYLNLPEIFEDSEVKELVETIKKKELDDLYLIGAKARKRLHEILDNEKPKPIEATAIMDRSFQQRRLLEGQSTQNIAYADIIRAKDRLEDEEQAILSRFPELKAERNPE
jgi:hypothetical protein